MTNDVALEGLRILLASAREKEQRDLAEIARLDGELAKARAERDEARGEREDSNRAVMFAEVVAERDALEARVVAKDAELNALERERDEMIAAVIEGPLGRTTHDEIVALLALLADATEIIASIHASAVDDSIGSVKVDMAAGRCYLPTAAEQWLANKAEP